ncbi:hypothetical protein DOY81_008704, partial [Sarcophaga bullata]
MHQLIKRYCRVDIILNLITAVQERLPLLQQAPQSDYMLNKRNSIVFPQEMSKAECNNSDTDVISPTGTSSSGQDQIHSTSKRKAQRKDDDQISHAHSSHSDSKSP